MQLVWGGEMKMFMNESRFRATAKTRCLALGFVLVLAAGGVLAGVTPGHDSDVSNAMTCECCQSLLTWAAHTEQESSCCDAPSPAQPAPAAAETCNSQRDEDSGLQASHAREASSKTQQIMFGEAGRKQPRAAGPHAYLLFCSFLI
jgi:hypothetical protein